MSLNSYYDNPRIQNVICYNVGFGDCFLCTDGNNDGYKMLVDCGTYNSTPKKVITDDIANELNSSKKKYLMLSHLHNDHYSGIKVLLEENPSLKLDEIYLPNYITNGSLELYAAMIFLFPNSSLGKEARQVLQIPGILHPNCANKAKIYFLSEGGKVCNKLCSFEALLPKKNKHRLWSGDVVEPIKEFCNKYREILAYKENENGTVAVTVRVNDNIRDQISSLFQEFSNIDVLSGDVNPEELKNRFKSHHNELSLAFHELGVEDVHNVLFLGDAPAADVKYIAKGKMRQEYCFVKVQHHGTNNHFCTDLPKAQFYVFSNSNNCCNRLISTQYNSTTICGAFICTNQELCPNAASCIAESNPRTKCGFSIKHTVVI